MALKTLAHFTGQHQLPRLLGKARKSIVIVARRQPHFSIDADTGQKMRLRGKAGQFESGLARRLREKSEIHPRGDVLQSDIDERIAAHAMPVMTQRACRRAAPADNTRHAAIHSRTTVRRRCAATA